MRLAEVVVSRREKKMVMYQLTSVGSELLAALAMLPAEGLEAT